MGQKGSEVKGVCHNPDPDEEEEAGDPKEPV